MILNPLSKFVACALGALTLSSLSAESIRKIDFNTDWRFSLDQKADAYEPALDDSAWRELNLPHDWVIENSARPDQPFYQATGVIPGEGIGWYRKHFNTGDLTDKKVTVLFDGIYNNSEVWINGHPLGFHPYGYSPFHYDLTPHLKQDSENVLVVKVDHTRFADSRWYTGAGIYRNVELITTDKLHIPVWGTFVTTPQVSEEEAKVVANIQVRNNYGTDRKIELKTSIHAPDGSLVGEADTQVTVTAHATYPALQEITLKQPQLWDIENPHLYTAVSRITADGKTIDESTTRFGIRSIRFDADNGFFLNGKNMKIKGVCLHHDGGLVGAAVPKGVWRRRLEILRDGGCNAIRSAHNPASDEFLDLCDEMGFLVQDEFFDEWDNPKDKRFNMNQKEVHYETQGYAEHFQEWAERDLKNVMLSHRNHPSIIQWSIGNEIEWTYPRNAKATGFFDNMNWDGNYFWSEPPHSPEKIQELLRTLPRERYDIGKTAQKLASWTRELDTTRPVTANCILPSASHFSGYADALDVIGYSYRRVLYDYGHRLLPDKPIMGTENLGQWHEWKAIIERDHISGTFLWTGIDYQGEVRADYPSRTNGSGLLDTAGFAKPSFHMYKTLWSDEPHIHLATQVLEEVGAKGKPLYKLEPNGDVSLTDPTNWERALWNWHNVNDHWNYDTDKTMVVESYTNCEEAELFLNGKSIGTKRLADFEDRIMKWSLAYEPGELKIVATKNGREVSDTIVTHGEPASIRLTADKFQLKADGYDVSHLVAQLADAKGNPVKTEDREITFEVGEGLKVLGVDNGSDKNVQDFQSNKIVTHHGRALLIVQSKTSPSSSEIKAASADLSNDPLHIEAN
ncbi:MAG: DUF4982 domain-containing protein [Akkermansiaceae bacterium]|jgi:beta-galactosidase|nr:DUF4982 domain-containing protein [Akkermansiaceae bacterium]MDP4721351.1 DUF4982 domain-containing protein [Akkermansiaceae bacterium]MDP4779428.1 DUF4982 domain-containing protein [Akkermansiaceae bacterium]MDP4846768.1 DUF4982 domain-containing protein [Akkermansiaceae bacterium]MDP4897105.1 DUF4982 domain-containing protein [Akkermansiaceae bacterium]